MTSNFCRHCYLSITNIKKHFATFDFLVKMKLVPNVVHINATTLIWLAAGSTQQWNQLEEYILQLLSANWKRYQESTIIWSKAFCERCPAMISNMDWIFLTENHLFQLYLMDWKSSQSHLPFENIMVKDLFTICQSNWISDRLTDGPHDEETWELIINPFYWVSSEITPLQLAKMIS